MYKLLVCLAVLLPMLAPVRAEAVISRNLSAQEAYRLVEQREDLYLLDVRTLQEYREFRLNGASLVPIDQLVRRLAELPRDQPILVYCAVGSRSAQVVNYLARRGYPEVYNLYGGIYAWAQKGFPIVKGAP